MGKIATILREFADVVEQHESFGDHIQISVGRDHVAEEDPLSMWDFYRPGNAITFEVENRSGWKSLTWPSVSQDHPPIRS